MEPGCSRTFSSAQAAAVLTLNLRDLPTSAGELVGLLGASAGELFSGFPVAPLRVLVVDGAEAVQEGHRGTLTALAGAAFSSGINLTVVARDDAVALLRQVLAEAAGLGADRDVQQIVVLPLAEAEVGELLTAIPELGPIGSDPRSAWLLARPGLVDILLRADALRSLPQGAVAEADALAALPAASAHVPQGSVGEAGSPGRRLRCSAWLCLRRSTGRAQQQPVADDGTSAKDGTAPEVRLTQPVNRLVRMTLLRDVRLTPPDSDGPRRPI